MAQLEPGRESENHDPDIRATVRLECQTGPGESERAVWADPGPAALAIAIARAASVALSLSLKLVVVLSRVPIT